jgi:hypothetical protein
VADGSPQGDWARDDSRLADSARAGLPRVDCWAPVGCSVEDAQAVARSHPGAHSEQGSRWQADSPLPGLGSLPWLAAPVSPDESRERPDAASAFLSDPQTGRGELAALAASLRMKPASAEASLSQ